MLQERETENGAQRQRIIALIEEMRQIRKAA